MGTRSETAAACFVRKCDCAQSVLGVFVPRLDLDEKTALRLASPQPRTFYA
jgi:hypothetical protein